MKVLFGSGLLTPAIQSVSSALLSGSVPADWTRRWDGGPDKPQVWLRELVRKRIALQKWRSASAKGSLLQEPLVLGDLFNPATFINALRQQTARKLGAAIDTVKMVCSWDKDSRKLEADCPLPVVFTGLFLQGASFHSGSLQDSAPEASEMAAAPNVCVGFVAQDAKDPYGRGAAIGIPAYLTPTREEFLMELRMPTDAASEGKWVLAGVALFLSEDE